MSPRKRTREPSVWVVETRWNTDEPWTPETTFLSCDEAERCVERELARPIGVLQLNQMLQVREYVRRPAKAKRRKR